jgi:RAB protein geranylgeranyltransferase component A
MEQVMMYVDNQLQQVPCSKADVFKNKFISLIEKRQLMKFLTSITQPNEEELASLNQYTNMPFIDFLQARGLSHILQSFIIYTIALVDENQSTSDQKITTEIGLNLLKRFLASVGRYGNTPFLVSLYGTSELTQAFCRLSAVYGATYVLQLTAKEILVENGKAIGITNIHGQRILCKNIIGNAEHFSTLVQTDERKAISRCICITDKSLTQEELLTIRIPPGTFNNTISITMIQFSSATMSSPAGKYIVHLTCKSHSTAQQDLEATVHSLFNHKDNPTTDATKPNIIWNCYFNHIHRVPVSPLPENLIITPDPEVTVGLDDILEKSESFYRRICPEDEIFISQVPHPEDIIYEPVETEQPPDPVEAGVSMDPQVDEKQSKE